MEKVGQTQQNIEEVRSILKDTNSWDWDKCWSENLTPWDLGTVTPLVADLVQKNDLPIGEALVPGCGSGYDVVALASPERHVTGIDISRTAIDRAKEVFGGLDTRFVDFICADFFTYQAPCFNLIFDYTFFCALDPSLRTLWASKIAELLSPDGELITIIYPVMDAQEDGPPFAVSLEAYEKVLQPQGFRCYFFEENALAIDRREGKEFWGRWKRVPT